MNEMNNSNNKKAPSANLANAVTGNSNKEPNNNESNETEETNETEDPNETEEPNTKKVTINTGNQSSMSPNMMPTTNIKPTNNTPNININKAINNLNRNKNLTKKKNNISPQTTNSTLKNTPNSNTDTNTNSEATTNVESQTEGETPKNTTTTSEKKTSINRLVMNLLNHQIVLKLFHFQTEKYGAHKASDAYLEKYANTMDKFLEVAQGIYGKVTLKKYTLSGSSHTDENIVKHLNGIITYMREKIDDVLDEYTELINIRDELVGDAEQLKYLLTFK